MTDVPFLPAAQAELLRIIEQYDAEDPGLVADFLDEAEHATQRIAAFPEHGSPYLRGTRRVLLRRFPFSLVYQGDPGDPVIVAVAHHRQRPGYWVSRLRPD